MARLDHVKNISGLVELYGKSSKLRELVNIVVVGGYFDVKKSSDREEIAEIEKMHALIKKYNLDGQYRWISAQMNRARNGELYRYIADTSGAFVQVYNVSSLLYWICNFWGLCLSSLFCNLQPALYEAFGLTVVEAMTCGLPTFATCHGGPAEIIEHGISGFHIDPYHPDQAAALLVDFFQRSKEDPSQWKKISDAGLQRIYERFVFLDETDNSL
jgi:sucrose synthase